MVIYQPYTYLIGWSKQNMWYYGRRTAQGCHPSELWVSYFTSSKYVEEFRSEYGDPDIIQIRKTFEEPEKCKIWEQKVLSRIQAPRRIDFLNKSNATADMDTTGLAPAKTLDGIALGLVELVDKRWETGEIVGVQYGNTYTNTKLIELRKTKYWSSTTETSRENNRQSALKWHSDPERNKNHRAALQTDEYAEKQRKITTEKNLERMSDGSHQFLKVLTCPHCNKETNLPNAKRWHFDNCKLA